MYENNKKFTFRQKWFPTITDSEELVDNSYFFGDPIIQFIGRWTRSLVLAGALGLVGSWVGYNAIGNNIEYSHGIRTGVINKISEKGLFWKTYEGQMALEGIVSDNSVVGANVWNFSLDRQARHGENTKEIAEKIKQYLETGTKVKVTYVEQLSTWPWRSGTDYLVLSVEPIKKAEQ